MKRKRSLAGILAAIVLSIGMLNGFSKSEQKEINALKLCIVASECHPASKKMLDEATPEERIIWNSTTVVAGFFMGLVCPPLAIGYAL